jgi:uncharacterized membrane protein
MLPREMHSLGGGNYSSNPAHAMAARKLSSSSTTCSDTAASQLSQGGYNRQRDVARVLALQDRPAHSADQFVAIAKRLRGRRRKPRTDDRQLIAIAAFSEVTRPDFPNLVADRMKSARTGRWRPDRRTALTLAALLTLRESVPTDGRLVATFYGLAIREHYLMSYSEATSCGAPATRAAAYSSEMVGFIDRLLAAGKKSPVSRTQTAFRLLLGAALALAGWSHLSWSRSDFLAQVPDWLPVDADLVVVVSGIVEVLIGAALLLAARYRVIVGLIAAAFFIAIFPGNVAQLMEGTDAFGLNSDTSRAIRLVFQPVLVGWALWSTGTWRALRVLAERR